MLLEKSIKEFWKDDETNFYDSMAIKATEAIKEDVKRAIKVFQSYRKEGKNGSI